jgi:hypothetical protein
MKSIVPATSRVDVLKLSQSNPNNLQNRQRDLTPLDHELKRLRKDSSPKQTKLLLKPLVIGHAIKAERS